MSKCLSEVNQLPLEDPTYVLQGLTKCYVPKFISPFDLMLNQERVTQMGMNVSLVNNSFVTLKCVLYIIVLANNRYHSLNTSIFGIFLRASVGIIQPINLTTLLSVSFVEKQFCSQIVIELAMKRIFLTTVNHIWINALMVTVTMAARSGPRAVVEPEAAVED